jgi:uncharacterized membrane protein HdeD (DUF308 family)
MKNNDFIKAPLSVNSASAIKLDYRDSHKGNGFIIMLIISVMLLISSVAIIVTNPEEINTGMIVPIIISLIFIGIMAIVNKAARNKHQKFQQEVTETITQGQKIIGSVISSESITVGSGDDSTTYYFFVVEFDDPQTHEKRRINTPYLNSDMCIYNSDLPLRATVYVRGEKVYVDEILDPPLDKIKQRKHTRTLFIILVLLGFFALIPTFMFFDTTVVVIGMTVLIAVSIAFCIYQAKQRK